MSSAAPQIDPEPGAGTPVDQAMAWLAQHEARRLYALGVRFCGNETDAADMVQDTFIEAQKSWGGFRGDSRVSTWLYRIAWRVCQRSRRKQEAAPGELPDDRTLEAMRSGPVPALVAPDGSPLQRQIDREMLGHVESAIARLPMEYRVPIVLKEIVGFSVREVAEILGIGSGAVKTRLHRARLKIAEAVGQGIPTVDLPAPEYDERVCLDLLAAKQDALDRQVRFPLPSDRFCQRCAAVFAALDLGQDVCARLHAGELPETVKRRLLDQIGAAGPSE